MPPQNVGTSMNLQIVLNTPKNALLESNHTEKIFAKLFYKKTKQQKNLWSFPSLGIQRTPLTIALSITDNSWRNAKLMLAAKIL